MRHLLLSFLFGVMFLNMSSASVLDIIPVTTWTEYEIVDGVRIEYIFQDCNSQSVSNQTLVLFRFTNTTNTEVTLTWKMKTFRNGVCSNCARLENSEYFQKLKLSPGEVFEGDCSSKVDKRGYVFSNFINKSPGMSDSKLTDFEFVEIKVVKQ